MSPGAVIMIIVAAFAVMAVGCNEEEPRPAPLPSSAALPAPSASVSTRARTRTYYVDNVDAICSVFWQEGAQQSVRKTIACPREIEPGERLRLAGRTCMREGQSPDRNIPIRCPKNVLQAEWGDRHDDREYKLSPQK